MKKYNSIILITLLVILNTIFAQNNALSLDGVDDKIVNSGSDLNGYTAITIEAWVFPQSFNPVGDDYISNVAGHEDASALLRIGDNDGSHMIDDDRPQFVVVTGSGADKANALTQMNTNTWYHIAGTYDGSNIKIYVNGNLEDSEPHTGTITTSETDLIFGGTSANNRMLKGILDEVRIWSTARSESEIRQNMYRELSGSETGLVLYYNLNETTGTTADNTEGTSSYDGTLTNMIGNEWLTSNAIFGPKNYLDFDGSINSVNIPSDPSLDNSLFSIEFWMKMDDTPTNFDAIVDKGRYTGTGDWYVLTHNSSQTLIFGLEPGVEIYHGVNDNNWHHCAMTFDGTNLNAYVDGKLVGSILGTYAPSTNNISLGKTQSWPYNFNGGIDDLRIWSDVRTATEIRENMCKYLVGNESNLVAYYTFDYDYNPAVAPLADFSTNSNNGTLVNFPIWTSSTAYNIWLNTDESTWGNTTNWSLHTVPSSTDNVAIYDYTGGTPPTSSTASVQNFLVNDTFTLGAGLTVSDNLILLSDLDLNGQNILLGSKGTLIEDTGFLYGGSTGQIYTTRDLNNIDEDVAGLGANITTLADMGSTTIIRKHAPYGTSGIERSYQIIPSNNTGLNATLVFNYRDAELNGNAESLLELYKSSDGITWTEQSASTVNTTDNTLTLTGIDGFSYWTASESGKESSLPVELTSFELKNTVEGVECSWTTESEFENLGFAIERKAKDGEWQEIVSYKTDNTLIGRGTTSIPTYYEYVDKLVEPNTTYDYRLLDIDYNGKVTRHAKKTITTDNSQLSSKLEQFTVLPAYPNPFNPSTTITYGLNENSDVTISIYDLSGNLITTLLSKKQPQGWHTIKWNGTDQHNNQVPAGIYLSRITSNSTTKTSKLMLLK